MIFKLELIQNASMKIRSNDEANGRDIMWNICEVLYLKKTTIFFYEI